MMKPVPPFQLFLEEQRELVYRFLLARVGPDEVDDCFQETFMAALRAYDRLKDGDSLRAWALKIAERKAIDAHRAAARRPPAREELPEAPSPASTDHEPSLWRAVRGLPDKQRAAIVHRYVADLPYVEIARITGTSEAAARQNVRAGLGNLRKVWREEGVKR
ncbi:MAG: RNA polymerase sigma factor [Actinomycetota bacterium]